MTEEKRASILIVDDNYDDRRMFSRYLEKAGFAVRDAEDISAGLAIIKENDVQCILLDYRMPTGSGIDMLKVLKSDPELKFIPVIILTGLESEEHILEGLNAGANDYVGKSSSAEIIVARVNALLREKQLQDDLAQMNSKLNEINVNLKNTNVIKEDALERLKVAISQLREISIRDGLTGLYNHAYFVEMLEKEYLRAKRYSSNLCCIIIDIDYFKNVNDSFGHLFGDNVLKEFADCLRVNVREVDILARYGGEEFSILLMNTDYQNAFIAARRIKNAIEASSFGNAENTIKLTVSIGISSLYEDGIIDRERFFGFADIALYGAKMKGRNAIVLYRDLVDTSDITSTALKEIEDEIYGISRSSLHAYNESVKTLILEHESRDIYTKEHSINVMRYAVMTAKAMELPEHDIEIICNAAILHDLGKIGISDQILQKKEKLTNEEYNKIKRHPVIAFNILKNSGYLRYELQIILHHHERFDGKGYPLGLKGHSIPLGARIIAVADSYDAMRAARPYREAMPVDYVLNELVKNAGAQFDPEIVPVFLQCLEKYQLLPPESNIRSYMEKLKEKNKL